MSLDGVAGQPQIGRDVRLDRPGGRLLDPFARLGQIEVPGDLTTDRSPRWHSSTISASNSEVNERRGRGFFLSMLAMAGHPSWERTP